MALIDDLTRRIKAKRQELAGIDQQIAALTHQRLGVESYLQAMEDAVKLAERKPSTDSREPAQGLRKNSMPAKAYPVLKQVGRPLYLVALLEGMNVPVTAKNKRTLASSLSAYARRKEIFTRPEPNTFGLIEFDDNATEAAEGQSTEDDHASGPSQLKLAR